VTDALDRFLSPDDRAALRAPIELASPFPNVAYTSQDYFDLEVDRVFARGAKAPINPRAERRRGHLQGPARTDAAQTGD
jgi:hypothetical protein